MLPGASEIETLNVSDADLETVVADVSLILNVAKSDADKEIAGAAFSVIAIDEVSEAET